MTLSLRQARRLKDKTQKDMAKTLKVHVMTYRRIEENPELATIEQAKKISEYLGVNYNEIFLLHNPNFIRILILQQQGAEVGKC